jgi:hypothetical protein
MALQAQERFLDIQHVRKYRPVGRVASGALIGHVRMLPGKGADELSVTAYAQPPLVHGSQALWVLGAVGFVTVHAQHLALRNRVAGHVGKGSANTLVAPHALLVDIRPFKFLAGAFMQLMAVRAADLGSGVIAEGPVLHVGHGVRAVAFEAKHGKGRGWQFTEGNVLGVVTLVVFGNVIGVDGFTAGTVARLTVDEGHIGALYFLLTVDAFGKKRRILVMEMARFEACLIAHVIGKKRAHQ